MTGTLEAGLEHEFRYRIPETKIVAALYPEAPEFQEMPHVLATGFLVGLIEWTCVQLVNRHIDWPREQTLGTHVDVSHTAPTPPGMEVAVSVRLAEVDGRRLVFDVRATDGSGEVSRGTHERFVVDRDRFVDKVGRRAAGADGPSATA